MRENYVKNVKKNDKFIVKCVNKKMQNKGRLLGSKDLGFMYLES